MAKFVVARVRDSHLLQVSVVDGAMRGEILETKKEARASTPSCGPKLEVPEASRASSFPRTRAKAKKKMRVENVALTECRKERVRTKNK